MKDRAKRMVTIKYKSHKRNNPGRFSQGRKHKPDHAISHRFWCIKVAVHFIDGHFTYKLCVFNSLGCFVSMMNMILSTYENKRAKWCLRFFFPCAHWRVECRPIRVKERRKKEYFITFPFSGVQIIQSWRIVTFRFTICIHFTGMFFVHVHDLVLFYDMASGMWKIYFLIWPNSMSAFEMKFLPNKKRKNNM